MSILIMSQVWIAELDPVEKLVALCIADFADDEGKAWPSLATVAKKSGLAEITVRRKLKSLADAGHLTITTRTDKSGRQTTSLIEFSGMREGISQRPSHTERVSHREGEGISQAPLILEPSFNHQKTLVLFDKFYQAYPKRKDRAAAEKAFIKLNPSPELFAQMMDALGWQRQQPEWLKNNGQFIPLPASWINGRRWEDERPDTHTLPTTGTADAGGASAEYLRKAGLIQ